MEAGKGWSSGQARARRRVRAAAGLLLCLLAGCCLGRPPLDQALLADPGREERNRGVAERYLVACPDVLEVTIAGRPPLSGRYTVQADGCVVLGPLGRVRVEGLTTPEIAARVAEEAETPPAAVRVRVAEYNSQQIYLVGAVTGWQRAVPYQGPETVLDLLQRAGGITPGAAPGEVYVLRCGVAEGRAPAVYHIDLAAILRKGDARTNLRLQPFDQVSVGESRPACYARCIPPCLRGLYDALWGMRREGG